MNKIRQMAIDALALLVLLYAVGFVAFALALVVGGVSSSQEELLDVKGAPITQLSIVRDKEEHADDR